MSKLEELNKKLKEAEELKKAIEEQILEERKVGKKEFIDSIKDGLKQYGVTHTDLKAFLKARNPKKDVEAKPKKVKVTAAN